MACRKALMVFTAHLHATNRGCGLPPLQVQVVSLVFKMQPLCRPWPVGPDERLQWAWGLRQVINDSLRARLPVARARWQRNWRACACGSGVAVV